VLTFPNRGLPQMSVEELAHHPKMPPAILPYQGQPSSSDSLSLRLLEAKQELIGVTADGRVEYLLGVIVILVRKN
jgi:hypothetical protein